MILQKSRKEKKVPSILKPSAVGNPRKNRSLDSSEEGSLNEMVDEKLTKELKSKSKLGSASEADYNSMEELKSKSELDSASEADDNVTKKLRSKTKLGSVSDAAPMVKEKRDLKRKLKKTKFEEYVEMEMKRGIVSADEDLEMERKLAKKLKVKGGKLRGLDDGMNLLFGGIPSPLDSAVGDDETVGAEENVSTCSLGKKRKKRRLLDTSLRKEEDEGNVAIDDAEAGGADMPNDAAEEVQKSDVNSKYIAPHLRSRGGSESEECSQIRRRVRGRRFHSLQIL